MVRKTLLLSAVLILIGYSLGVVRVSSTNTALGWVDHGSGWVYRLLPREKNHVAVDWIYAAGEWLGSPAVQVDEEDRSVS